VRCAKGIRWAQNLKIKGVYLQTTVIMDACTLFYPIQSITMEKMVKREKHFTVIKSSMEVLLEWLRMPNHTSYAEKNVILVNIFIAWLYPKRNTQTWKRKWIPSPYIHKLKEDAKNEIRDSMKHLGAQLFSSLKREFVQSHACVSLCTCTLVRDGKGERHTNLINLQKKFSSVYPCEYGKSSSTSILELE